MQHGEDYSSVKVWKKDLKSNSHDNRLSLDTEKAIDLYVPLFLEYKQKNPDEIIEEALVGKSVVKESLSDFCTWLEDEQGKSFCVKSYSQTLIVNRSLRSRFHHKGFARTLILWTRYNSKLDIF